jgi:hypothetical protein
MKLMKIHEHSKSMSTPRKSFSLKSAHNKAYMKKPIVIYTAVPYGDHPIEEESTQKCRSFFRYLLILSLGGIIGYMSSWFLIEAVADSIAKNQEYADSRGIVKKGR